MINMFAVVKTHPACIRVGFELVSGGYKPKAEDGQTERNSEAIPRIELATLTAKV
jgi:hypothetical protein